MQEGPDVFLCKGRVEDIPFWRQYFDLERDYGTLKERLAAGDAVMAEAVSFAPGIHLLRQEFFETLISFILSQNNHIPRIRGLAARLCAEYGKEMEGWSAFPTPEELARADEASLLRLGCGFRAVYLVDAVKKYAPEDMPQTRWNGWVRRNCVRGSWKSKALAGKWRTALCCFRWGVMRFFRQTSGFAA